MLPLLAAYLKHHYATPASAQSLDRPLDDILLEDDIMAAHPVLPFDVEALTFEELKARLSRCRGVSVRRHPDTGLIICHNDWKRVTSDPVCRAFHSVVMRENEEGRLKLLMCACPSVDDDIRDRVEVGSFVGEETASVWEAFEGPTINVYHDGDVWRFSTTKCVDMFGSTYGVGSMSHGQLFLDVVGGDLEAFVRPLDPGKTYGFVLVHPQAGHLVDYTLREDLRHLPTTGFLVHTNTRDRSTWLLDDDARLDFPFVHYADLLHVTGADAVRQLLSAADENNTTTIDKTSVEGLMVAVGARVMKAHTEQYRRLESVLPHCSSVVEALFKTYQRNCIDDHMMLASVPRSIDIGDGVRVRPKQLVHQCFNALTELLLALYRHFTVVDPSTGRYEKVNNEEYARHVQDKSTIVFRIARLQDLTKRRRASLDGKQVWGHLHSERWTPAEDLVRMVREALQLDAAFLAQLGLGRESHNHFVQLNALNESLATMTWDF